MKKKLFCRSFLFCAFFLLFAAGAFADDELLLRTQIASGFKPVPVLRISGMVRHVAWSSDATYFVYTDSQNIVATNEFGTELGRLSNGTGRVELFAYAAQQFNGSESVVVVSQSNAVCLQKIPAVEYPPLRQFDPEDPVISVAISRNGSSYATAQESGTVNLFTQLIYTQQVSVMPLRGNASPVVAMAFSDDNKHLAGLDRDNNVIIWSLANGAVEKTFNIKKRAADHICFSRDSSQVLVAPADNRIYLYSLEGKTEKVYELPDNISKFSVSSGGKALIAQCKDNSFYFYDMSTAIQTSYVPAYSQIEIMSYDFDLNEHRLVVGHKDGSIYVINMEDAITDSRNLDNASDAGSNSSNVSAYFSRNAHSIELRLNAMAMSYPYVFAGSFSGGYTNAIWFKPFYTGGMITLLGAPPLDSFAFQYSKQDSSMGKAPWLTSLKLSVPFGVTVMPFGPAFEMFGEIQAGFSLHMLYSSDFGNGRAFPAFSADFLVGLGFRRIVAYVGGSYDTILGFNFSGGAGYRIKLGKF